MKPKLLKATAYVLLIWVGAGFAWIFFTLARTGPFGSVQSPGLDVRHAVDGRRFVLQFHNCSSPLSQARWFLHAVPADTDKAAAMEGFAAGFFNLDWRVELSRAERLSGDVCRFNVDLPPIEISRVRFGQFETPQGKCCSNIWQTEIDVARVTKK